MKGQKLGLAVSSVCVGLVLLLVATACEQQSGEDGSGGVASDGSGGDAGSGGIGGDGTGAELADYEVIATSEGSPIWDVRTSDTHVYWLTRGTTDLVTGVDNLDGAVYRQALDGGDVELVVDELARPARLRLSDEHAYLWLMKGGVDPERGYELFRVRLDGGEPERVETGGDAASMQFAAFEDRAYLGHELEDGAWIVEHAPGQEPRQILDIEASTEMWCAVDASHLYYQATDGLHRLPLAGGSPEFLADGVWDFDLSLETSEIVAVESVGDIRPEIDLVVMPMSGGPWETLAVVPLPANVDYGGYSAPEVAGERWYVWTMAEREGGMEGYDLIAWTGLMDGGEPEPVWAPRELSVPPDYSLRWAGAPHALFFASVDRLVKVSLD